MSKRSEVGHAKNVAQFSMLVVHCESLGAAYNPANPAISLPALQTALAAANQSMVNSHAARNGYLEATNVREIAFTGLTTFTSRVVGSLKASGVPSQTVDDAKFLLRKLRGQRAPGNGSTPAVTDADTPAQAADNAVSQPGTPAPASNDATTRRISASQRSYDLQSSHFSRLVLMLAAQPLYVPNEPELGIAGLQILSDTLASANLGVQQAITAYENANIARNAALYAPGQGIVSLAADTKEYVKSLFGPSSEQYRTVSRIRFKGRA